MADKKNPYENVFGGGTGGSGNDDDADAVQAFGNSQDAQTQYTPDEVVAQDWFRSDLFGNIDTNELVGNQEMYYNVALTNPDYASTFAVKRAMDYWTQIYGGNLAPVMQAALAGNGQQYKMLKRLIANIAQMDMDPIPIRGPQPTDEMKTKLEWEDNKTVLLTALQDPTYLDSLPTQQRNDVIKMAQEAQKSLVEQAPGNKLGGVDQMWVFRTIAGQTRSGNYDVFLNTQEKDALDLLVSKFGNAPEDKSKEETRQSALDQRALEERLGVVSIEGASGKYPKLVLDRDWARAHPIKAAAVMDGLRERFPGVSFQVGEDGIVGDALNLWGKATDFVAIPFSWGIGNATRWLDELREGKQMTPAMREEAAQDKKTLEDRLARGEIPPDKYEDTLRAIRYAEDISTTDYSYGWSEAVDNGISPRSAGTALGDTVLDAVNKEPGDPGMTGIYAVANLVEGIVFDPANYVFPFVAGARQGLKGVAAAGEAKGVIDTTVDTFRKADDIANVVKNGRHAIFEADDALESILRAEHYKPQKITLTKNGKPVEALLVPNVPPDQAIFYAGRFGQTEVITREGLIEVGNRTLRPLKKVSTETAFAENSVKWGANRGWAYEFTNRAIRIRPPRIGTGWLRSKGFQMFAPTPEELIASPHMQDAAERIIRQGNELRATYGAEEGLNRFSGWLQDAYQVDPIQARQFAHAQTPEEVLQMFYMSITGGLDAPINAARHGSRITDLAKRLDAGDAAEARLERLRTTPQSELVTADELNEIHADLTGGHQREGFLATDQYAEDVNGALAKRVKVSSPGRIDDILENLDPHQQYLFRTKLQKIRIAKSNIINAPEKLARGRDFAGGGRFYTDVDVSILRNQDLLETGGAAQFRVRGSDGGTPVRSAEDLASTKRWMEGGGLSDNSNPIMVEVLPNGKLTILDGTHRLMLAEEMGIERVPVQFNTSGLETADRTYTWLDEHMPEALEVATPMPDDLVELTQESRLFREAEDTASGFRTTRDADVAELSYLRSVSQGRTWKVPIRKLPPRSRVKRVLTKALENHEFAKGTELLADFAEKGLPLHLAKQARLGTARILAGKAFAESEQAAKRLTHWMSNFFRNHSAGSAIDLGRFGSGAVFDAEGNIIRLVDEDVETMKNLRNMAHVFGLKKSSIDNLMGGFINARGFEARFAAYNKYWETIAEEAPGLGALERKAVAQWSNTELLSRNPGYLSERLGNGINDATPTHWSIKTAPDGTTYQAGRPVFSADALHTVHLPDIEQVLNWISFNRRLLNSMKQGNKVRKLIAGGATAIHETWHIANQSIKTLLLAFRMPLALPLRIVSEEHLRMAAFDNATVVNHPLEWFKMFRGSDEFAMFGASQTELLGLLHEQFLLDYRVAKVGRRQVVFGFDDDWYNAASVRLQQIAKSPEVRGFYIDDLSNPKRVLARMESNEGVRRGVDEVLTMWDDAIKPEVTGAMKTRLQATERALGEIKQLVGDGPAAERIRKALKTGRYSDEAGKVYELGSREFADELRRVVSNGEWNPGAKVLATREMEYMFAGKNEAANLLRQMRDGLFRTFYTGIDQAVARQPLWRGLARKEYDRLLSLGWKPARAKSAAEALAYRQTADMLYRIGETSTGHHFARNISPFLPAFQELTTTWLYRIPKEMGAGFLLPGYARLARKADVYFTFLKQAGLVQVKVGTNPDTGEQEKSYIVPVPGLGELMGAVFGAKGIHATASLESFTGILPDPTKGLKALIPGLGSPTSYLLGEFANKTDIADEFVDALLPFGREATLGPTGLNRLLAAAGIVPFWEAGTADYQRHLINSSIDDGIQIAMEKYGNEMPKREDFKKGVKGENEYVKAHQAWAEKIVDEGEKWSSLRYLTRGIGTFFLPFTVNYSAEKKDQLQTIWALINAPPESERTLASPLINAFKETYPGAVWYSQGKSINLAPDRDFSVGDPYFNQIADGMRDELTPEEYLRFSVGMNSYYVYLNRRNQALRESGDTPYDILTNGFDRGMSVQRLDAEWNQYLALTEKEDPSQGGRSFAELFGVYQDARDEAAARSGGGFDVTVDDAYMLDVKKGLQALSGLFTENGIRDGDYRKILGVLSEAGSGANYPEPTTAEGKAIQHWYDGVAQDYYDTTGKIYDLISITDKRLRGPLYEQLRRLANAQKPTTYNGFKLPTPEEVAWGNLSQREQDVRLVEWAKLQPEWLTNFQLKKLGVGGDPKALDAYATYAAQVDQEFQKNSMGLHPSSKDYQNMQTFYDNLRRQKAEQLGVEEIFDLGEAPPWARIDRLAGRKFNNASWDSMIQATTDVWSRMAAADNAVAGETPMAEYYQKWLVGRVEEMKAADPEFRKLLDKVKEAFVPSGSEDMGQTDFYWKFLFNGFLDTAPKYLVYGGDK